MIELQINESQRPGIDTNYIEYAIISVLSIHAKEDTDITLRFTDNSEISVLNQNYRGNSKATDVLAFNQDFLNPENGRYYLGDIVISIDMARQQAHQHGHSLNDECAFLAIHGVLHLLGYDHDTLERKQHMWSTQKEIFEDIKTNYQETDNEKKL